MIGLDTNVLLRYIVRDDAAQAKAAGRLIEARCSKDAPGHVSHVVLAELAWVLGRGYGYAKAEVVKVMEAILSSAELKVQESALAWAALRRRAWYHHGATIDAPKPGALRDDMELREQPMPSEDEWASASRSEM